MNSTDEWVRGHDGQLEEIARDAQLSTHLIHIAAVLVLEGLADEEIYDLLREHIVSLDGHHDPLAGAPRALEEIRLLAST